MPNAKTFGYGASAINYCCPTDELIRPSITGTAVENECSACYTTTLSNCGNYGKSLYPNLASNIANFQMVYPQSMKIYRKTLAQILERTLEQTLMKMLIPISIKITVELLKMEILRQKLNLCHWSLAHLFYYY